MGKRGRPPHPDILTPREWQVLALIREGLTNEQIALRLDISLATAKYHVSEILSKLCVNTREEAAAWQPYTEPRRWQRALAPLAAALRRLGPLTLTKAVIAAFSLAALGVLAGLVALTWAILRTGDEGDGDADAFLQATASATPEPRNTTPLPSLPDGPPPPVFGPPFAARGVYQLTTDGTQRQVTAWPEGRSGLIAVSSDGTWMASAIGTRERLFSLSQHSKVDSSHITVTNLSTGETLGEPYSTGSVTGLAVSDDGRFVAVAVADGERHSLQLIPTNGSAEATLISGLTHLGALSWAPYAELLTFAATDGASPSTVYVADPNGELRQVAEGRAPAWSPDGTRIAFARTLSEPLPGGPAGSTQEGVFLTDLVGNISQTNSAPYLSPANALIWSPDASRLALQRSQEVWVHDLNTAADNSLGQGHLASWSPDGFEVAVIRDSRVWAIRFESRSERVIDKLPQPGVYSAAWLPDRSLVYGFDPLSSLLVAYDIESGVETPLAYASKGVWSPTGERVALEAFEGDVSGFGGPVGVYVANADGSAIQRMGVFGVSDVGGCGPASGLSAAPWSPDGRLLTWDRLSSPRILVSELTVDPQPLADGCTAVWSPTSRKFVYVDDAGYLILTDARTGDTRRLERCSSPAWSPDGREIACLLGGRDIQQVWVLDSQSGEGRSLYTLNYAPLSSDRIDWAPDGRSLAFVDATLTGNVANQFVKVLDLATGAVTNLGSGEDPHWSRDGKTVFIRGYEGTDPLLLAVPAVGSSPGVTVTRGYLSDVSPDGRSLLIGRSVFSP